MIICTILGLCESCSEKLNYHSKKREIKRLKKYKSKSEPRKESSRSSTKEGSSVPQTPSSSSSQKLSQDESDEEESTSISERLEPMTEDNLWKKNNESEIRGRDEEFDEYLADLLL